jgi:hypothetical protein
MAASPEALVSNAGWVLRALPLVVVGGEGELCSALQGSAYCLGPGCCTRLLVAMWYVVRGTWWSIGSISVGPAAHRRGLAPRRPASAQPDPTPPRQQPAA